MITHLFNYVLGSGNFISLFLTKFYYIACAGATLLLILLMRDRMPADQGRAFAVNGELSRGKLRGLGLLFVIGYVASTTLFIPISWHLCIFLVILSACMLTGFLDDAGSVPWGGLKKGLLDLGISVGAGVLAYFMTDGTVSFAIFNTSFHVPIVIYVIFAAALVWGSINVVNCTDGVDGLCTMLTICSLIAFAFVGDFTSRRLAVGMVMCLLPYLWFNASPSSMLMGDAGSRALGLLLAMLALRTYAFLYLLFCLVFILDGGLGLLKLALLRSVKIHILKNTRTPLHDHVRKNLSWSDAQTVIRFTLLHIFVILITLAACMR